MTRLHATRLCALSHGIVAQAKPALSRVLSLAVRKFAKPGTLALAAKRKVLLLPSGQFDLQRFSTFRIARRTEAVGKSYSGIS
jgi:hypothetical protein